MHLNATVIYPVLGSSADLWFVRIAGHGLGNSFYTYFHAVALAERYRADVVAPPWFSAKLGPLLRGEPSKRFYWRMFKPFAGEIHGLSKLLLLLRRYRRRVIVNVDETGDPVLVQGALNFVVSRKFTFLGLHAHRRLIRQRLVGTVNDPVPPNHCWGTGGYIAIHIRLGDFTEAANVTLINRGHPNLRIPLAWYISLIRALRHRYSEKTIYVFSDGDEETLAPILAQGATLYRSGSDMTDLLAMSGASILVGSNSTYSKWAAFLGNMPSIWLQTSPEVEKPSAHDAPVIYVPLDCSEPTLWDPEIIDSWCRQEALS